MIVRYVVTFEFDTRAPVTHRGTVAGGSGATCVARATRIAQKALRPVGWSSMVCCLLDRVVLLDPVIDHKPEGTDEATNA